MEIMIDGVKLVKTKEIKDGNTTVSVWQTDIVLPDGDTMLIYERNDDEFGFDNVSFNPFSGIPTGSIYIDAIHLDTAARLLGISDYDDDLSHLAVAIKMAKKILNLQN
jgi:hypothetical protein